MDMVFDNSGRYLASGCVNGHIKILDCSKGTETHNYKIHSGSVNRLIFHPNP